MDLETQHKLLQLLDDYKPRLDEYLPDLIHGRREDSEDFMTSPATPENIVAKAQFFFPRFFEAVFYYVCAHLSLVHSSGCFKTPSPLAKGALWCYLKDRKITSQQGRIRCRDFIPYFMKKLTSLGMGKLSSFVVSQPAFRDQYQLMIDATANVLLKASAEEEYRLMNDEDGAVPANISVRGQLIYQIYLDAKSRFQDVLWQWHYISQYRSAMGPEEALVARELDNILIDITGYEVIRTRRVGCLQDFISGPLYYALCTKKVVPAVNNIPPVIFGKGKFPDAVSK